MRRVAGEGVTLEPQLASHAAELFEVIGDPTLYGYIDQKAPLSEAALRERLEILESRLSPDGLEGWLNWVVRNDAGAVVGYVQATVYPTHEAEIAYVLGRPYWRQGYGHAACRAMIDELRSSYSVTCVIATLDPANAASRALLEKLGLSLVSEDKAANEVTFALDFGS